MNTTMQRIFAMILPLLLLAAGAHAQQMPERSLVRKGTRQYHKGNYEAAISRYEEALKAAPGQFEATYDLGNALYKAERYDHAEQTMRQAAADSLRSETERAEAYYNLGNAQFQQKKYKEALESYKQSLRLNPADMEAKYNYAYTKRLLDNDQNGGGGNDNQQNQDQNKDQNQNQNQNQGQDQNKDQNQNQDQNKDQQNDRNQDQNQDGNGQQDPSKQKPGQGQPTPSGISPQEQEQMLDAIQAQEDKTQEKLKEKNKGVVIRGKKNW